MQSFNRYHAGVKIILHLLLVWFLASYNVIISHIISFMNGFPVVIHSCVIIDVCVRVRLNDACKTDGLLSGSYYDA